MMNLAFHSLLRWKRIILLYQFSLPHLLSFSLKCWENVSTIDTPTMTFDVAPQQIMGPEGLITSTMTTNIPLKQGQNGLL